ncbi:MAG: hypothetical protein E4H23_07715 [Chrysiogenales bacterium]|jgi:hypothetical protein|nr:hypothetical protein [Candidatus Aminicenantes bacterium]TFG78499.1 MAG: hypothetical protein E4H23_07715 [Chrysiogenales bacterium]
MTDLNFRVKVSGDLCHRSGYVQNAVVKNLCFAKSTSRVVPLTPGAYSLTVFVGASFGKTNVDYAVELIPGPAVQLHVPANNPIRALTVGITGFVVIDFTLS